MKYYLGIDGGGTKTAFLLADENGNTAAQYEARGCSYKEYGMEAVAEDLKNGALHCLMEAGADWESLGGIAIGLPCYGESRREDQRLAALLEQSFAPVLLLITNDVEVGWAGSLGLKAGINVVAGTGSIAFGKNSRRESARAGGWSSFFGDEGSCYWLGRRAMELFSKEADGREEMGALYRVIMEKFSLEDPMDFIDLMEDEYVPCRSKVASMQRFLLEAAKAGDANAIDLYRQAAEELGKLIHGVAQRISVPGETFGISYSGGLFHAKEFVLPVLEKWIGRCGGYLVLPKFTPVQGALLLCLECFAPDILKSALETMEQQKAEKESR